MTITTTTLKNAAFAIEHDLFTDPDGANYLVKDGAIVRRWEPATSSADSFELMAALEMEVSYWSGYEEVRAECGLEGQVIIAYSNDRSKDTRAAIVLCAANIGANLCQ